MYNQAIKLVAHTSLAFEAAGQTVVATTSVVTTPIRQSIAKVGYDIDEAKLEINVEKHGYDKGQIQSQRAVNAAKFMKRSGGPRSLENFLFAELRPTT